MTSSCGSPQTEVEVNLEEVHDFLTSLSIKAGSLLRKNVFFRSQQGYPSSSSSSSSTTTTTSSDSTLDTLRIEDKDSSVDIVTDVDLAVEEFIISKIRQRFPEYQILAEETYAAGGSKKFELDDVSRVTIRKEGIL